MVATKLIVIGPLRDGSLSSIILDTEDFFVACLLVGIFFAFVFFRDIRNRLCPYKVIKRENSSGHLICFHDFAVNSVLVDKGMGRLDRERRDPGKTSSGIAHAYIQPLPFYTESSKLRDSSAVKMPSQPISETMDCYRGQSAPPRPLVVHYSPLQALSGQLDANQAPVPRTRVLSTTHTDFRPYSRSELARPPDLGANLTKSSAYSRLPAHKAPPTVSCHPRLALQPMPLPYGGKNSVYKDTFTIPGRHPEISSPATTSDRPKHTNVGDRGLLQDIMEVPKMYNTENQRYGSTELVLV